METFVGLWVNLPFVLLSVLSLSFNVLLVFSISFLACSRLSFLSSTNRNNLILNIKSLQFYRILPSYLIISDLHLGYILILLRNSYVIQKKSVNMEIKITCEQALRGRSGSTGLERKESLQLLLWNSNSTSNFPVAPRRLSCKISANQSEAEMSANLNKH